LDLAQQLAPAVGLKRENVAPCQNKPFLTSTCRVESRLDGLRGICAVWQGFIAVAHNSVPSSLKIPPMMSILQIYAGATPARSNATMSQYSPC
ncbi:hypothetical protein, partial [Burkholderia cenocepacia]|uniref:hypothetical protein n=1 Tax=Burkholderia cenocepacia TaxID=95486 RepID=UPI002231FAFB